MDEACFAVACFPADGIYYTIAQAEPAIRGFELMLNCNES